MIGRLKPSKEQVRFLRAENRKYGDGLVFIHPADWPPTLKAAAKSAIIKPVGVWRSRHFTVQAFEEKKGIRRITVNRSDVDRDGEWKDGISWDELQHIKEVLFPGQVAIEVFPPAKDVVNVSNMRHLWVMPEAIAAFIPVWRDGQDPTQFFAFPAP